MASYKKRGGKWYFIVDIGRDPVTGKRKQKMQGSYPNRGEAVTACAAFITAMDKGEYVQGKETLKGFLLDYLENHLKHSVGETTYQFQRKICNKHIIPALGDKLLKKLTPMDVQKFYSQKIKEGYSSGHVRNLGSFLGKAMKTALEWGMVSRNVVQSVSKPSYKSKNMGVWTLEQVQAFLDGAKEYYFYPVYMIALTTGMRMGEIAGLPWDFVDLNAGTISVRQAAVYTNGRQYLKEPKNESSRRLITLPDFAVSYLKRHKVQQPPNEYNLVCPGIQTPIFYANTITNEFNEVIARLELPPIRFHDLRHTHATLLLQLGENPKVVQERLGHATISTTLNIYSHVVPSMQKAAADRLNDAMKWV